ncbi:unnamed protein product [Lepeophtheirus salmonis]|uniref:(salmon louse) hypothetical protein n=1 Tax=Lepeophtheirus salmonis TaxID=72036 RepID=A0A7R8D0R9_LEPSM|nr:unnamed protein product [Lepeophtheirus salmonis]CAF2961538.1 unnamed protein product [Lepeophtheirus salmonis]
MFELCSKHYYIDNENIEENEEENRAIFQELILRNIEKVPIFKSTPSQDSDDFILDEILKFSDSHSEEELNSPSIKDLHAPPDSTSDHSYEKDSMPKGEEIENEFDRKKTVKGALPNPSFVSIAVVGKGNADAKYPQILNEKDSSGKNALHYCSGNQNINSIDQILSADPSLISQKDDEGYTPLHLAVISGNKAIVKYLLSKGADVDAVDDELHSSVHWATVCGEVDCLEILIQEGAKTATPDIYGAYPVHYSAQICGKSSDAGADLRRGLIVLKRLIKFGVDVNVKDRDGRQPLMWAASSGSSDAILCLVNAGANVYETDKDGLTPLHCTASRGHRDCVEALVGLCGADVSIQDYNGCTPLFYSVTLGHLDCTRLLLDYGSDPNVQDKKGRTSAHCGAAKGQLETLKLLNKSNGRKELIRWLLNQKPEAIDCCNNEGRGALHIAAMNNNVEVCKILIDNYADINIIMRNSKGDLLTPLDAAHTKGNKGCAKYIKLHGGLSSTKLANKDTLHKALTLGLAKEKETTLSPEDLVPDRHRPESTTLECTADDYLQPIYKQPKGHDQTLIDNDQDQIYEFSKDDDLPDHLIHSAYDHNSENDHSELSSPSVIESLLTHVDEDHIVENATSPREKATTQRADSVTLDVKESGSESPITVLQLPISSNKSSIPLPEMNPIHTQTENLYENVTKETQNDEENTSKTDSGENDDNFGEEEGGKRLELPEKENNATKEEERTTNEHDPSKEEDALRNTSGSREGTQRYDEPCEEEDKSVSLRDGDRASSIIDEISDDSTRINLPTMDDSGIGGERSQDEDSHLDSNSFLKKKEFRKRTQNHSEYYSEDEKVEDPLIGQSSSSSIHGGDFRPSTVHGRSDVHSDSETRNRGAFHLHRRPVRESYRYQNKLRSYQIKPRKGSAISITQAVQMSLRKYKMEPGRSIQNPRPNHHLRRIQESHAKLIPKVCKTRDDIELVVWDLQMFTPADCTHLSHRCHHAAHAYSGIPCFRKSKQKSIILPKIDDGHTHSLLASTRIRKYDPNEPLTIELTHGTQKQCVKLPTDSLEKSTKILCHTNSGSEKNKKNCKPLI